MGFARRDETNLCVVGGNGVMVDLEDLGSAFFCLWDCYICAAHWSFTCEV